jgi:hypothetical protein
MGGDQPIVSPIQSGQPMPYGTPEPDFGTAVYGAIGMGPDDPEWQAAMRGRNLQDMWTQANQILQDRKLQGDDLTAALQRIGIDHRMFPTR